MPIVQEVVSPLQQAFIPNRSIHRTIQTTKVIASQIHHNPDSPNLILMLDLTKAFDSLDLNYLRRVLNTINIPPDFINLLISTQNSGMARILNGPKIIDYAFPLQRGVRQGLAISPILFNLALEPLICKLASSINGR
ncbi:unnamed protein product [Ambrosiozyma monospora]|uniref:Unnamed protein product n=1 Tax=Ambrosiozyma monospora TaxID=43982 RepID=A0A9W6YV49_AMBMO|nr:unnamed protein product [Ambrosiozyma monospora]